VCEKGFSGFTFCLFVVVVASIVASDIVVVIVMVVVAICHFYLLSLLFSFPLFHPRLFSLY